MTNNLEQNASDQKEEASTDKKRKKARAPWGWIIFLLILIALCVAIYWLYTMGMFSNYFKRENNLQIALQQTQNKLTDLENQTHALSENLISQNQLINSLRQAETGYNRDEWRVLAAEFLVNLASDKLQYDNDAPQALRALQEADQQMRNLNDVRFSAIRKALASDIASLQAVPQLDIQGLHLRLLALIEQVRKLPLPNMHKAAVLAPPTSQPNENLPWWKRGLQETWQSLQKIVVVRYNENGKLPLIMPEQKEYLYQNLQMELEKADFGLIHQQNSVYQTSLQQAIKWINQYFATDAPETKGILKNLAELQAINVHPELPNLSNTLNAFRDYFAEQNIKVVPPPTTTGQ